MCTNRVDVEFVMPEVPPEKGMFMLNSLPTFLQGLLIHESIHISVYMRRYQCSMTQNAHVQDKR